jgi:hypothetical protein
MKPSDLVALAPTVSSINNGWAFAAFVLMLAVIAFLSLHKKQ